MRGQVDGQQAIFHTINIEEKVPADQATPGRTVRVRCVTTPDKAQKVLLNRLGLRLPQHLRYLDEVAQM